MRAMDRLTVKSEDLKSADCDEHYALKSMCTFDDKGNLKSEGYCGDCCDAFGGLCYKCEVQKAFDRLAVYENTELTPEEIIAMKVDNERLHKLVDATQKILWDNTEDEDNADSM